MVTGLELIADGKIKIGDRLVSRLAPNDRHIAMAFSELRALPGQSGDAAGIRRRVGSIYRKNPGDAYVFRWTAPRKWFLVEGAARAGKQNRGV
jgi:hypothetical protein